MLKYVPHLVLNTLCIIYVLSQGNMSWKHCMMFLLSEHDLITKSCCYHALILIVITVIVILLFWHLISITRQTLRCFILSMFNLSFSICLIALEGYRSVQSKPKLKRISGSNPHKSVKIHWWNFAAHYR